MGKKQHNQNIKKRQSKNSVNESNGSEETVEKPVLLKKPGKSRSKSENKKHEKQSEWFNSVLGISVIVVVLSISGYFWYREHMRSRVYTPYQAERVINTSVIDTQKFWGTYRPNVYFGMKTRSPRSAAFGMMWFVQSGEPKLRHSCEQGDGLLRYGWLAHDGINFGIQEIMDKGFVIMTEFVKRPSLSYGGDWSAKVTVRAMAGFPEDMMVSLLFYQAIDKNGWIEANVNKNRLDSISGYTDELGNFNLKFPTAKNNVMHSNYLISYVQSYKNIKDSAFNGLRLYNKKSPYIGLAGQMVPPGFQGKENLIVHQVTFKLPFTAEVVFESAGFTDRPPQSLSGNTFDHELNKHLVAFDDKFNTIFQLDKQKFSDDEIRFAKAVFSNMVGGIGYFTGRSIVHSKHNPEPVQYWEASLYTGVPSRSFFPRGFLWDEGFHNLLISKWDPEISKDIIGHWLDLMNVDGWIPREQILGDEARSKVPDEFVIQRNSNANPPTLFLPLQELVKNMIKSGKKDDLDYLRHVFPRLQAWYNWFNTSQTGPLPSTYQWKGRNPDSITEINPKTLTSGLDDFPRASHPTSDERHLDLRCWMTIASGIMFEISKAIGEPSDEFKSTYDTLMDEELLNELHWSKKDKRYADYGFHSDNVKLERPKPNRNIQPGQVPQNIQLPKQRVVYSEPKNQFINSYGYVSLFPFLLQILQPSSPKLGQILEDLRDPKLLWTPYGLRSLSRNAPLYNKHNTEHDPPYWRGYIWINMNYLAVRSLHHYANTQGPYQKYADELYKELRSNLINNIYNVYKKTGYVWENYDDKSGEGRGCHPFTGWSALVVLMMSEKY